MNDGQLSHRRRNNSPISCIKKRKVSNSVEHKSKSDIYTPPDKYLKYYLEEENEEKDVIEDNTQKTDILITFKNDEDIVINSEEIKVKKKEEIEKCKKEINQIIIQLKEEEMIEKRYINKRPLIVHIIPISLIAINFMWYYIINSIIYGDISNFNGTNCNKLFHSFWVLVDFYFWITIFLLVSFIYDKTIAHFNETLEYIGVVIFIIVQVFHYVGILYFIIKISYAYSFLEPCNLLINVGYYWLNMYYIILIICFIFFINEYIRVFNLHKENDKINKND